MHTSNGNGEGYRTGPSLGGGGARGANAPPFFWIAIHILFISNVLPLHCEARSQDFSGKGVRLSKFGTLSPVSLDRGPKKKSHGTLLQTHPPLEILA